ncbi:ubiquitin-conjugating enzyme/RWD-like protein [Microdochium bolleyi]|uniref:Ubiquitin-conjugating enzyme/RWD-like protein n=1 Tax=Microdochium bolleyi TaxID=196109 RepID=A0A136JDR3_9PEZI|nr:ubiquitin-conjugating enzyme/RWD-like protein [Microdochium bolleyi]
MAGGSKSTSSGKKSSSGSGSGSGSSSRSATKRLIKELGVWEKEKASEHGIERLGPVQEEELLEWEAVINGRGIGAGYDEGRWLLHISIPTEYPNKAPKISFVTPIVHANIALQSGEICLDLLKDAWTPAYSILESVRAVRMLLGCPETDSPLNVDVAALIRAGDGVGARRLVEFWVADGEGRYEGR